MSEKEYIDFKKEFREFKKELENSKPLLDDEVFNLPTDDFDTEKDKSDSSQNGGDEGFDFLLSDDPNIINGVDINSKFNEFDDYLEYLEGFDKLNDAANLEDYPQINLETDDLLINISIKKDYSKISDLYERKKEFFNDLRKFIDEFESTEESDDLMEYYE